RLDQLRARVGLVTQDVQLFQGSVRDNLTLFDRAVTDARLTVLLEEIGLGDFVRALPDGLDAELGAGGAGLSAGQAQLLALARLGRLIAFSPGYFALAVLCATTYFCLPLLIGYATRIFFDALSGRAPAGLDAWSGVALLVAANLVEVVVGPGLSYSWGSYLH